MKTLKEIFAGWGSQQSEPVPAPAFMGCCGGGHHHHDHNETTAGEKYQCPMKCEGNKTYDKPGNCPVCNMHLQPVTGQHKS